MSDFDEWYRQYKAEEDRRLNGHFPWTLARRVAFSRWRRAVLWLCGVRWVRGTVWYDRLLDALYPDDCMVTFVAVKA